MSHLKQFVPKTFEQTNPKSNVEEFFIFYLAKFMQFFTSLEILLLDWTLGIVVFGTDC